ncbi:MAG: carboxypeptidase regulatory-like domain-containing protein, partial [Acidobacteria bacterium]|nr:carboxypeptidase regulatory-like domain-containing protein [Acidobacteriota bacterium]
MITGRELTAKAATAGLALFTVLALSTASMLHAQEVRIDADDIGGVVSSAKGPEAGVWVIAETMDLPTKFVRVVVTDDQGRYLVPDLPKANYSVWVRGYG